MLFRWVVGRFGVRVALCNLKFASYRKVYSLCVKEFLKEGVRATVRP